MATEPFFVGWLWVALFGFTKYIRQTLIFNLGRMSNRFYYFIKQVLEAAVLGLDHCLSHQGTCKWRDVQPSLSLTELESVGMESSSPYSFKSSPGDANVQPRLTTLRS